MFGISDDVVEATLVAVVGALVTVVGAFVALDDASVMVVGAFVAIIGALVAVVDTVGFKVVEVVVFDDNDVVSTVDDVSSAGIFGVVLLAAVSVSSVVMVSENDSSVFSRQPSPLSI